MILQITLSQLCLRLSNMAKSSSFAISYLGFSGCSFRMMFQVFSYFLVVNRWTRHQENKCTVSQIKNWNSVPGACAI